MTSGSDSEWEEGSDEEEQLCEDSSSSSSSEEEGEDGDGPGGLGLQEEEEAEEDQPSTAEQLEEQRQANVKALISGSLLVTRKPLLPRLLSVQNAEAILRQPFRSPHPNASAGLSETLRRKLQARRQFVPWGNATFVPLKLTPRVPLPPADDQAAATPDKVVLPPGIEPLVLWEPPPASAEAPGGEADGSGSAGGSGSGGGAAVVVDDMLTQWLRPHQREGVQFMFECVCGLRKFEGQGCILADDMGLGKTLQGITLLWTLLNSGHPLLGGRPVARRVVICCPTSLVSNWDSECSKWLKGRARTLPLCESSREDVISSITQFLSPRNYYQVLIVSYETFRLHAERFASRPDACDLLICDEAHRLKNDQTLTNKALGSLACKRRVLLSGTPLQNHLDEFYAMVSFCNPGVLGSPAQFRKRYELPILAGREPGATEEQTQLGAERSAELSAIVNEFILRRTNSLLSAHLPPKVIEVVCCRMTPLQYELYCHFLQSKATKSLFASQKAARVLSAITSLRKLLNHPKLIYDALHANMHAEEGGAHGFEDCGRFFPPGMFDAGRAGRGGMMIGWELLSGKFAVLARMLEILRATGKERIVIVSNYTQTLDLVGQLCREKSYPFLRLDGTTTIAKRQKLVKRFNDPQDHQFVFLLSSKAGGCGLNLIGGNRLVLFDPDWNPANDKQAAARVWRDGQKKKVFVYRFLTTGTIEEKVYQRQLSKEGLQQVVNSKGGGAAGPNLMSMEELRDLFSYDPATLSNTYDSMCRDEGQAGGGDEGKGAAAGDAVAAEPIFKAQEGKPAEEDLQSWGHHSTVASVPDAVMQQIGDEHVSFIFSCQVEGKPIEPELSQGQQPGGGGGATTPAAAAPRLGPGRGMAAGASRLQPAPAQQQQQQRKPVQRPGGSATPALPRGAPELPCCRQPPDVAQPARLAQPQAHEQGVATAAAASRPEAQQSGAAPRQPPTGQAPPSAAARPAAGPAVVGGPSSSVLPADKRVARAGSPPPVPSHAGKENSAGNAPGPSLAAEQAQCQQQPQPQPGRPAGRWLLSLPKRPPCTKPSGSGQQQTSNGGGMQKRKLAGDSTAASKRVVYIISDSDDDFP